MVASVRKLDLFYVAFISIQSVGPISFKGHGIIKRLSFLSTLSIRFLSSLPSATLIHIVLMDVWDIQPSKNSNLKYLTQLLVQAEIFIR